MITFQEFPKIPRLRRELIVTEKIDGTNAAIHIVWHSAARSYFKVLLENDDVPKGKT